MYSLWLNLKEGNTYQLTKVQILAKDVELKITIFKQMSNKPVNFLVDIDAVFLFFQKKGKKNTGFA